MQRYCARCEKSQPVFRNQTQIRCCQCGGFVMRADRRKEFANLPRGGSGNTPPNPNSRRQRRLAEQRKAA